MNSGRIKQFRYRAARILRKTGNRLMPKGEPHGADFSDIGIEKLGANAPRALVIFSTPGIERYVQGRMHDGDPFWNKHTVYWESVEIARQLNAHGYIVDYADNRRTFSGDWSQYAVVIDGSDNLRHAPPVSGQIRVHYTTYIHWLTWNRAELQRIAWFKERTGIVIPMNRQLPNILSDEYATHLTYYGTQTQADSFSPLPIKRQLNISAVYAPEYQSKNIEKARQNFIWLGGGGLVHKGLDIAMEAFAKIPQAHLYIAGDLKSEPRFWEWAQPFLTTHSNIHDLGWMDVGGPEFDHIARECIGIVYPSGAEGGPGSVAQAIHWGLIPIVTKSALVRAEVLGTVVRDATDHDMITSTMEAVQSTAARSESDLRNTCSAVAEFARANHTRTAYGASLSDFIGSLKNS
jgi:glycosyltransferase involved in cell wall biosynthesis